MNNRNSQALQKRRYPNGLYTHIHICMHTHTHKKVINILSHQGTTSSNPNKMYLHSYQKSSNKGWGEGGGADYMMFLQYTEKKSLMIFIKVSTIILDL